MVVTPHWHYAGHVVASSVFWQPKPPLQQRLLGWWASQLEVQATLTQHQWMWFHRHRLARQRTAALRAQAHARTLVRRHKHYPVPGGCHCRHHSHHCHFHHPRLCAARCVAVFCVWARNQTPPRFYADSSSSGDLPGLPREQNASVSSSLALSYGTASTHTWGTHRP